MNSTLLVTRTEDDYQTRYISTWAESVMDAASKHGHVIDLKSDKATRIELEGRLKKKQPSLVFFNGHGDSTCVTGFEQEVLIKAGDNDHLLKGSTVYALACSTGQVLAPSAVAKGAKAFIGYDDDFALMIDESERTRCQQDKIAALILDPSNKIMTSLIKGHTVQEAYDSSQAMARNTLRKHLTSEAGEKERYAMQFVYWNMQIQNYYGDPNTTVA